MEGLLKVWKGKDLNIAGKWKGLNQNLTRSLVIQS